MLKGIEINPEHPLMYNNLGSCYLALNKINDAQEAFKTSVKLNPTNATSMYNLATSYQLQQKHTEAFEYFKKAYEMEPTGFIFFCGEALEAANAKRMDIRRRILS